MSTPVIGQVTDELLKMDGTEFQHEVETFDFYFEEPGEVNEVNKAIIEYTGGGSPNLQIEIGTRKRQSQDVNYSAPISYSLNDGSVAFYFRSVGVGKYIRFRFKWNNNDDDFIEDLRLISITKVTDGPDVAEK